MDITQQVSTLLTTKMGVPQQAVSPESPLRDLGVDSLALEELRLLIEEDLDVDLESAVLTPQNSVGELLAAVHSAAA
ncbi:phosphopantetheine-binding protein [Streptomyces pinistramenti]|uniref:phosphopantetheine-binding protein n=1 Tax=Streptomyces pinistramenti TaxID=2884812 RepID=UPI001D08D5F7|nr:phosphopantetheine-binding protein [Streptomyces pinistramenti]MCB5910175.1 phosphopantetheine-binding protein [Streptomyces pinistramenti]